jgi:hypothetical protein
MGESETLYVLGDGDRVRDHVERLLLSGKLQELSLFSGSLSAGLSALALQAETRLGAEVLMAGGDDLLLRVTRSTFSKAKLEELGAEFLRRTGCSISFGVGGDAESAYLNLRRAKAHGGGAVVCDRDIP